MKKEHRLIILSCVMSFVLLWGVSVWQTVASHRMKKAKSTATKLVVKPTFQPYDMTGISVIKKKKGVKINIPPNGGDPPWPELRILATVLQQDKVSSLFSLTNTLVALSSSSTRELTYNRKKQALTLTVHGTMAGVGATENSTTICKKITDALLFKLLTKKPGASLWNLGVPASLSLQQKRGQKKLLKIFQKALDLLPFKAYNLSSPDGKEWSKGCEKFLKKFLANRNLECQLAFVDEVATSN